MPENLVKELCKRKLIKDIPSFLPESIQKLAIGGSFSYGVSSDTSDCDIIGWCIPDKDIIFPHLQGVIRGFGDQGRRFDQWQAQGPKGITDPSAAGGKGKKYDFCIYNVIKFFQLLMENNPTQLEALFVPQRCIIWSTPVSETVDRNRHIFLSKKLYHTLFGYAYQQMKKMTSPFRPALELRAIEEELGIPHSTTLDSAKELLEGSKSGLYEYSPEFEAYVRKYDECCNATNRFEKEKIYGYCPKFGYHIVRLACQAEQVMNEGTMDLERYRELYKEVRRGEWSTERIKEFLQSKENMLSELYNSDKCILPYKPDEGKIRKLLYEVLETHFRDISTAVKQIGVEEQYLREIGDIIRKYESREKEN